MLLAVFMLETLLYPKTVAVIGASRNPEKAGHAVLANLVKGGFQGTIIPVNPGAADRPPGLRAKPAREAECCFSSRWAVR